MFILVCWEAYPLLFFKISLATHLLWTCFIFRKFYFSYYIYSLKISYIHVMHYYHPQTYSFLTPFTPARLPYSPQILFNIHAKFNKGHLHHHGFETWHWKLVGSTIYMQLKGNNPLSPISEHSLKSVEINSNTLWTSS